MSTKLGLEKWLTDKKLTTSLLSEIFPGKTTPLGWNLGCVNKFQTEARRHEQNLGTLE